MPVGVVCDTDAELLRAFDTVRTFDRATCRRRVEQRFSVARMADEYEAVYEELIAARRDARAAHPPRLQAPRSENGRAAAQA